MAKNVLLVNPWIFDFAAHNFAVKPIGLLRIASYLRLTGCNVTLIDCMDDCSKSRDENGFSKFRKQRVEKPETIKTIDRPYFRYGISDQDFLSKLDTVRSCDYIYLTSGMTYWYPGVFLAIKLLIS